MRHARIQGVRREGLCAVAHVAQFAAPRPTVPLGGALAYAQKGAVYPLVFFEEHIEHHFHAGRRVIRQPAAHGVHGDGGSFFLGKAEHARADTAEGDAGVIRLGGSIKAGAVAFGKLLAMLIGRPSVGDGPTVCTT